MNWLHKRVGALEARQSPIVLHCPQDGDDHAAKAAELGTEPVAVVHFPGLNDEAVAAFQATRKHPNSGPPSSKIEGNSGSSG